MKCVVCDQPHSKEQPLTLLCGRFFCELHLHHPNHYRGESGIVFPDMQDKMGKPPAVEPIADPARLLEEKQ